MPVLSAEACMYPDDLLTVCQDQELELGQDVRSWYVLHTKPRQEKAVLRGLLDCQVPTYLPLYNRTVVLNGRKKGAFVPLFPSYVFLFGDVEERLTALETNRLVRVLPVTDQESLRQDLQRIQQLIDLGIPLTVESRFEPGRRVRIKTGAMRGIEGTLMSRRGQGRLLVSIDFLQQGASIAVDDCVLEAID